MTNEQELNLKERWTAEAKKYLLGRRIIDIRWMTDEEQEALGWDTAAVVLLLDDGTCIWPAADDEGNGAGVLYSEDFIIPALW